MVYSGSGFLGDLASFDVAFLDGTQHDTEGLEFLREQGTIPICVLNIGEDS